MKKLAVYIYLLVALGNVCVAQDPHFTQYQSAPFTVNPAYVGSFNGVVRCISNYRQQWDNLAEPYVTSAFALDSKIGLNKDQKPINVGFQFLNDRTMNGVFRSNYLGVTVGYHVNLDQEGFQTIGAGLSSTFGNRRIDYSSVSFDQQFTSGGFDLTLPSGEAALSSMKPFVTVGAGLLYRYDNSESGEFFEFGLSAFHLNKPKQTFLSDPKEYLPVRVSSQVAYQKYLGEKTILNLNLLFQNQAKINYWLGGASIGEVVDSKNTLIGVGASFRTKDAVSPYIFGEYSNFRLGMSYDFLVSNLKKATSRTRSFEFSLQWVLKKN